MIEWRTEKWPVAKLKEWKNNPRKFTTKGMDDLRLMGGGLYAT